MNIWRKRSVISIVFLAFMTMLSACSIGPSVTLEKQTSLEAMSTVEKVEYIMSTMSTADKVGQLVMMGVQGQTMTEDIQYMLNEYKIGGVILFDRNMKNKEQVHHFIRALQKQAKESEKLPLFIAIDQEGGAVARMQEQLESVPAAAELGKQDVSLTESYARKSAYELKELGFNVNFAPVLDIGLSHERSYGNQPEQVITYSKAAAKGYEQEGIIFALKHFPGIGRAKTDLHEEENSISVDQESLRNYDIKPFAQLIKDFKNPWNYMVMVSHAKYEAFDLKYPASMSPYVIQNILRHELGFQGVIITDDMEMGAVANHYSFSDMSVQAVNAGVDIVLVCHEYSHVIEAYNGILKAVQNGTIDKEKLNDAVRRVVRMKVEHHLYLPRI